MKDRSHKNVNRVVSLSFFISFVIFQLVGLFGYLQFTDKTDGNILNNFTGQGGIVIPVILVFAFVVVTTYPFVNFTCRVAVGCLIWHDHQVKVSHSVSSYANSF
jgi:sodium-coupled neutral amino acid transporter 11